MQAAQNAHTKYCTVCITLRPHSYTNATQRLLSATDSIDLFSNQSRARFSHYTRTWEAGIDLIRMRGLFTSFALCRVCICSSIQTQISVLACLECAYKLYRLVGMSHVILSPKVHYRAHKIPELVQLNWAPTIIVFSRFVLMLSFLTIY